MEGWVFQTRLSFGQLKETMKKIFVMLLVFAVISQSNAATNRLQTNYPAGVDLRIVDPSWNVPIRFFGKVIDDSGNAVSEAEIVFDFAGWSSEEKPDVHKKSENDGLFSLTGGQGTGLFVSVSKEGYYTLKSQNRHFEYGDPSSTDFHQPNAARPVVFQLRKKGKGEPLIAIEKKITLES